MSLWYRDGNIIWCITIRNTWWIKNIMDAVKAFNAEVGWIKFHFCFASKFALLRSKWKRILVYQFKRKQLICMLLVYPFLLSFNVMLYFGVKRRLCYDDHTCYVLLLSNFRKEPTYYWSTIMILILVRHTHKKINVCFCIHQYLCTNLFSPMCFYNLFLKWLR